ncbi:MAG TPA: multiheme c-type cytochrome [Gemmatimonadales bacterium]
MMTHRPTLAVLALVAMGLLPVCPAGAAPPAPPIHRTSAEACAECHPQTYRQWRSSLHAQSTPLTDPIHGAFYRKEVGDPRVAGLALRGRYPVCLQCHVPAAAIDGETRVDADPAYQEGVTCVSCHTLTRFKGVTAPDGTLRLGMQAYERSTTHLQGPTGGGAGVEKHPFPMAANGPLLTGNGACMGCHERRNNAQGVPLCRTGDEYAAAAGAATCQSCHMPRVRGITDHAMLGGHSAAMVRRGVTLTVTAGKKGNGVAANVSLHNRLPHGFPTGAPFRSAYLEVVAVDALGHEVWRNYRTNPTEDPQAMLATRLVDDAGHPALPPKATRIAADTRLNPGEQRQIAYQIPAAGITEVRARLLYRLLPPDLEQQLAAVLTDARKGPKVAAVAITTVE